MVKTQNEIDIKEVLKQIPAIAEKESWLFAYDADEGAFFYSPERITGDAELYQVDDEYSIYLNKNNKPEGLFIECYDANFIEHHKELKEISKELFKINSRKSNDSVITINPHKYFSDDKKISAFKKLFEKTLMIEAAL